MRALILVGALIGIIVYGAVAYILTHAITLSPGVDTAIWVIAGALSLWSLIVGLFGICLVSFGAVTD